MWNAIARGPVDPKSDPGRSLFISLTFAVLSGEAAILDAKPFEVDTVCGFYLMKAASEDS